MVGFFLSRLLMWHSHLVYLATPEIYHNKHFHSSSRFIPLLIIPFRFHSRYSYRLRTLVNVNFFCESQIRKKKINREEDEEEYVSSHWLILRWREGTENWNSKH